MVTGSEEYSPPRTGAPPTYEEAMGLFADIPPPPFDMLRIQEQLPGAVTTQPSVDSEDDIKWMPLPRIDPGSSCPYGLEYLLELNTVLVKRERWRMFEGRRYGVSNSLGEKFLAFGKCLSGRIRIIQVYIASDTGTFCYSVQDHLERHAFTIKRESYCMCYGMASECAVECPPGQPSGFIIGSAGLCMSNIVITDGGKSCIFNINAPIGRGLCEDENMPVCEIVGNVLASSSCLVLSNRVPVANIRRRYPDVPLSERFDYIVTFPIDLEVRMKAALIATAVKIDVEIAEQRTRSNN
ncbi:hypothetical protein PRIPAC_84748 [Pristionchus pacificus]|uniref:Phospholipid scramblase n=1 Tax=Pristionchus pacificus TaxID=54126 RepID=A0A2A6CE96_PRIPA|nr:hypothetical protein PRIPAC_84748 [Pristionchus pacificus]|eukprot:PDM76522.1 hypothetical protein PRIPAC_42888 [Pristionchus pacificus]